MTITQKPPKNSFKVILFYWAEEGELCIDCPQLGVLSVNRLEEGQEQELAVLAENQFHKKLREDIKKSGGSKNYLRSQVKFGNGSLTKDAGYLPNPFESFQEKYSYIQRVIEQEGCRKTELTITI
ncbi:MULTISPECIES: hypothetical protein [Flavobacteriaceae]|uniref:hypothetical protein n=1 Tax=Flavobacteriaceae TaxID=49546 RepID=UPI0010AE09D9|nr:MULTISPECIES: hypothetical protein [Flavobacteriaceae]NJB38117.1 hypothetical protein [Croceivirga sp. JEA036]TKD59030.1 hypothetical protein FBT53_14695 [Flavobacterium sp. ASW18X]